MNRVNQLCSLRIRVTSLLCVSLLLAGLSFPAIAQVNIHIVSSIWPPYTYLDEHNQPSGSLFQAVSKALAQEHIQYELRYYPWKRAYYQALKQTNTLIFPVYRSKQRESLFHWFCSISPQITINTIMRSDTQLHTLSLQELTQSGAVIGVMHDDNSYKTALKKGFSKDQLDTSSSDMDNVKKLAHGRVDVVLQSWESFQHRLNKVELPEDVFFVKGPTFLTLESEKLCAAVSKQSDDETVERLRRALANFQ
ncbi:substrate-binding periplasmic protein [Alteromonas sp. a30]|uniref:substrate-binding periplasmic protein n=1 Tax=Alteromonas sp. a30 TaxID=2730917 RepID=UPI00227FB2D7|nr:transporter substrate-binding domain-containing protein [Alteromonas sp. a30]MCY7295484.1 transporter substrate-binding domain-containing protein [Alteromonas sp. a30]